VIFLSSVPAWKYRTLRPLPPAVIASIDATRQYASEAIAPLPTSVERVMQGDADIVRMGAGIGAPRYLETRRSLVEPDWHLVTMLPIDPVLEATRNATIMTGFGYVSLCLLGFYWRMRRARVQEVMRSRAMLQKAYAMLNERVAERTADLSQANERLQREVAERTRAEAELRATQDELIQASKLAALGQMAAGITHELNQPLAALRSFSDNTRVFLERGQYAAATENLEAQAVRRACAAKERALAGGAGARQRACAARQTAGGRARGDRADRGGRRARAARHARRVPGSRRAERRSAARTGAHQSAR
jgi:two-component system C4-dicarboxylate transport sensor histidine kinase DctB